MEGTFYRDEGFLSHIGNANSGRYPRGSGKNPFQHVKGKAGDWLRPSIKSGKDKPQQSPAEKSTREIQRGINEASNAVGRLGDMKRRSYKSNAHQMSEADLNAAIRRMRLEQEYDRLSSSTIANGYDKAQDILATAGSLAGIAASAATVASVFYNIKHGKG